MAGKAKDYPALSKKLGIIVSRLFMGEALSVKELAEEFGNDPRTIRNYFNNYLKDALPLKKVGRRWALENIGGAQLDDEARIALETIEEMAKKVGSGFHAKLRPLLAKLASGTHSPIYTKLQMEDIGDRLEEVQLLKEAIAKKRVVKGRYRSVEGDERSVTLHPYRIANFDGSWYLIARDQKNGKVKKYYLRNLSDLSISKKRFEIPQDLERKIQNAINVWFDPHAKPFEVVLYADAVALRYLRRHPLTPTQSIGALDAEGGAEVRLRITHEMEIIPFIYSWIPHIFVMEPKSLAKKALEDAERFVKLQKEAL